MTAKGPIWVVATDATATRWSRALQDAGLDTLPLPWGTVVAGPHCDDVRERLRSGTDAWVVVPSASAIRFLGADAGAGRHVACVGPRTANAATEAGFVVGLVGTSDGRAMARQLIGGPGPKQALVLRGVHGRDEVETLLRDAGWTVTVQHTYDVGVLPDFATNVATAPSPRAVVHGSPHGVHAVELALAGRVDLDMTSLAHVAIGETTAHALRDAGCARVAVADSPSALALVATVQRVVLPREL